MLSVSLRRRRFTVLFALFGLSEALDINLDFVSKPNATSCFPIDGDPPSCDGPNHYPSGEPFRVEITGREMIEEALWYFDIDYLSYNDILWELRYHIYGLAPIQQDTDDCDLIRQIYHLGIWCMPKDDPDYERRFEFCFLEDEPCAIPENPDELTPFLTAVELNETCGVLQYVVGEIVGLPNSLEYCKRAESWIWACNFYCRNGSRVPDTYSPAPTEDSCWTFDDPPNCSVEYDVDPDINVNRVCGDMYYMLGDHWMRTALWAHPYAFSSIHKVTEECDTFRQVYSLCAWCHPLALVDRWFCALENYCLNGGERQPKVVDNSVNTKATCMELKQLVDNGDWMFTKDTCYCGEASIHLCDWACEQSTLGADTKPKEWARVWLARFSSFLSFCAAVYIIWDVVRDKKQRTVVYHQLLLCMAIFDLVTAVAWGWSTAALPQNKAWNVVGVVGNDATCRAQAFFIQLGFTSVFYNTSLATYYVLAIVYRWRENDLRKIRWFLHAGPLATGLGLAAAVVQFSEWTHYGCHILPPPDGDLWKSVVFVAAPLGVSVLGITLAMGFVYYIVRQNAIASRRWRFGVGASDSLERKVFWQSLLYTMSFYVTWPIMFAVYLGSVDYKAKVYPLTAIVGFVAPLQGFSNFLVYIRPRRGQIWEGFRSYSSAFLAFPSSLRFRGGDKSTELGLQPQPKAKSKREVDPSVLIVFEELSAASQFSAEGRESIDAPAQGQENTKHPVNDVGEDRASRDDKASEEDIGKVVGDWRSGLSSVHSSLADK